MDRMDKEKCTARVLVLAESYLGLSTKCRNGIRQRTPSPSCYFTCCRHPLYRVLFRSKDKRVLRYLGGGLVKIYKLFEIALILYLRRF